jgi:hypothetical protein
MRKRITKIAAGIAALAALALGGAAISQAGSSTPTQPTANPGQQTQQQSRTDTKSQSTPADRGGSNDTADRGNDPADQGGANDKADGNDPAGGANEPKGKETNHGTEQPGSEVPGNDGPGGHADEPGNPGADHQAQGQE